MEALFSAAVGELVSRWRACKTRTASVPAAITVKEAAEGRLITNKGMLQQLKMLREQKHKGYYVLDKVRYLDYEEVNVNVP